MAIKMIVTDLDGTFYHKDLTYDKERFDKLYKKMKEESIHFVVASGNQYFQLKSFFDHPEELTFVAENGGYIVKEGKEMFSVEMNTEIYHQIIDVLANYPEITITIICGKNSAYVTHDMSEEDFQIFLRYFPQMIRVNNLHEIQDQIIKLALMTSEERVNDIAEELSQLIDDSLTIVTSGHGCIDFIVSGVHKGFAIQKLMDVWNIQPHEVMAFGDARNDLEMLKTAGYGFVMANGTEEMKQSIGRVSLLSNEEDGELAIIEEYFENPNLFLEKYKSSNTMKYNDDK